MYTCLVTLHKLKVHTAEPLVPEISAFEVERAIEKLKDTNHQVLIKFQKNWFNGEIEQFVLRSITY
jgi:hypothetical protein